MCDCPHHPFNCMGHPHSCPCATEAAWGKLERLAREIDPSIPDDLSGKEIRITISLDFQSVEVIDRSLTG